MKMTAQVSPKIYYCIRSEELVTDKHSNPIREYRYLGYDSASGGYPFWSSWISGVHWFADLNKTYEAYLDIKENPYGNVSNIEIVAFDESKPLVCNIDWIKSQIMDDVTRNALNKLSSLEKDALMRHFGG